MLESFLIDVMASILDVFSCSNAVSCLQCSTLFFRCRIITKYRMRRENVPSSYVGVEINNAIFGLLGVKSFVSFIALCFICVLLHLELIPSFRQFPSGNDIPYILCIQQCTVARR